MHKMKVIGAAILPFACDDKYGCAYFLLGKERCVSGWHDSGKWSDFGGSMRAGEDAASCAAREFREETMGVVEWVHPTASETATSLAECLRGGGYTFRVDTLIDADTMYVTFVKQIVWQPTCGVLFTDMRNKLLCNPCAFSDHPAVHKSRVRDSWCEKSAVRWWSSHQLLRACHHPHGNLTTGRGLWEKLRSLFRSRVTVVMHEFPTASASKKHTSIDFRTYNNLRSQQT